MRIESTRFPFNRQPPDVRIDGVAADDRPLDLANPVLIPPLTSRVRVTFTSFALLYPERMRFRFRVEGVDPDWVDAGVRRSATWTPSGPGMHRFLVQARNEDGVWSAAPTVIDLDVLPAWWQTTVFRATATVGLAALTFALYRLRLRTIERRHAVRVRGLEEQRRSEERAESLRTQLEHVSRVALAGELAASLAHEVNQPLGAIVNNAETGRRFLKQYLQRPAELGEIFSDIVADGMRASEIIRGLRGFLHAGSPETAAVDLSALVGEMLPLVRRELRAQGVDVRLSLAEGLPPVDGFRVQLGQIVVNLVMNACEALASVDRERRITISTGREG